MEAEQARLQNDLQRQSDNYNLILTRRDREHQEEDNLATMLRSDVERLAAERYWETLMQICSSFQNSITNAAGVLP